MERSGPDHRQRSACHCHGHSSRPMLGSQQQRSADGAAHRDRGRHRHRPGQQQRRWPQQEPDFVAVGDAVHKHMAHRRAQRHCGYRGGNGGHQCDLTPVGTLPPRPNQGRHRGGYGQSDNDQGGRMHQQRAHQHHAPQHPKPH